MFYIAYLGSLALGHFKMYLPGSLCSFTLNPCVGMACSVDVTLPNVIRVLADFEDLHFEMNRFQTKIFSSADVLNSSTWISNSYSKMNHHLSGVEGLSVRIEGRCPHLHLSPGQKTKKIKSVARKKSRFINFK